MAVNVDSKYGGCPIYQSGTDENTVYLEDFSGSFIPFVISRPAAPYTAKPRGASVLHAVFIIYRFAAEGISCS